MLLVLASLAAAGLASCADGDEPPAPGGEAECAVSPSASFRQRIEPLLSDDRVATCNQCHLSGVNLSAFARETPCETWACLLEQGLVDVQAPTQSKILSWISRASPDSELITDEVIEAEHDGFLEWIEANASCPGACAGVSCGKPSDGPKCDDGSAHSPDLGMGGGERGCSDLELEQAFYDDVYAWRGRCFPCHYDTQPDADKDAPRWLSLVGNCETGSAVSLKRVLALDLIDLADPEASLLLRKPLDESGGGVEHGGGAKFTKADDAYASFLRFIQHYAECRAPE